MSDGRDGMHARSTPFVKLDDRGLSRGSDIGLTLTFAVGRRFLADDIGAILLPIC